MFENARVFQRTCYEQPFLTQFRQVENTVTDCREVRTRQDMVYPTRLQGRPEQMRSKGILARSMLSDCASTLAIHPCLPAVAGDCSARPVMRNHYREAVRALHEASLSHKRPRHVYLVAMSFHAVLLLYDGEGVRLPFIFCLVLFVLLRLPAMLLIGSRHCLVCG